MNQGESEYRRKVRIKVRNVVLGLLIAVVIAIPAFLYFNISTKAHLAFREAKNIKLATNMLAVEYYGAGKVLYDPSKPDGMAEGVRNRLLEVTQSRGDIKILGFDRSRREVVAFTYETGHIKVTFNKRFEGGEAEPSEQNGSGQSSGQSAGISPESGEHWCIDYIFRYAEYEYGDNNIRE